MTGFRDTHGPPAPTPSAAAEVPEGGRPRRSDGAQLPGHGRRRVPPDDADEACSTPGLALAWMCGQDLCSALPGRSVTRVVDGSAGGADGADQRVRKWPPCRWATALEATLATALRPAGEACFMTALVGRMGGARLAWWVRHRAEGRGGLRMPAVVGGRWRPAGAVRAQELPCSPAMGRHGRGLARGETTARMPPWNSSQSTQRAYATSRA